MKNTEYPNQHFMSDEKTRALAFIFLHRAYKIVYEFQKMLYTSREGANVK